LSLRAIVFLLRYLWLLAWEIVLSAITVAKLALGPLDRLRSGFVSVPLDARTDLEIAVFANSITLTPGTITVHVDPVRHVLVMHAIDIGQDPDAVRRSTKAVLEANILKWTRAGDPRQRP
jgi:multisubunit Na+/H+ antiporter MnhE subunit